MLEKMKLWLTKPLHAAIAAFIAGLFIGLVILGWWLWPVQWYDASPSDLRPDAQQDYVCMMIDSYSVNQNGSLAVRRYAELGDDGPALVAGTTPTNCPGVSQEAISSFQASAEGSGKLKWIQPRLRRFLPLALAKRLRQLPVRPRRLSQPKATLHKRIQTSSSFLLLGLLCLVTLGVGAAAFYLFVLKPRKDSGSSYSGKSSPRVEAVLLRQGLSPPARNQPPSSSPPT